MTSKQRAYLMSLASNLNPIFQVGKSSLTPELTAASSDSFTRTHSQVVQVIGKKIVLYKPDKDKPKIELPR